MTTARCPEPQNVKVILKSHGITRPDLGMPRSDRTQPSPYSSQAPQEATRRVCHRIGLQGAGPGLDHRGCRDTGCALD